MLEKLHLVLPCFSHRVRAVRAAVGLPPERAPEEASGLLVGRCGDAWYSTPMCMNMAVQPARPALWVMVRAGDASGLRRKRVDFNGMPHEQPLVPAVPVAAIVES